MTFSGLDATSNNRKSDRKSLDPGAGTKPALYVFNKHAALITNIQIHTYNDTNLNGNFSDSNILQALTKSSGDRSCERGAQKYTKGQRSG